MGPNVENQTVAGERPNAAQLVNVDTIDGKVPRKVNGAFMAGCALLLKPGWVLIGENISINEQLLTDATPPPDRC